VLPYTLAGGGAFVSGVYKRVGGNAAGDNNAKAGNAGAPNTGSGGGTAGYAIGGAGGSGVIIIRYSASVVEAGLCGAGKYITNALGGTEEVSCTSVS
jgi:hypothetical protein